MEISPLLRREEISAGGGGIIMNCEYCKFRVSINYVRRGVYIADLFEWYDVVGNTIVTKLLFIIGLECCSCCFTYKFV